MIIKDLIDLRYVDDLVTNAREEDVREYQGLGGQDYKQGVLESVSMSKECYVATDDEDNVLMIYGVVPHENIGIIWAVGTPLYRKYALSLTKAGTKIIKKWLMEFDTLTNCISEENLKSFQWLSSKGAIFVDEFISDNGMKYKTFIIERSNICVQ